MDNVLYIFDTPRDTKICQRLAYPITERDATLEKMIAKEYECPVCFNFTVPPIMMCINSHVICFDCWRRCISCPTCRAAKTLTRAFTLERIHPLISFPCRWDGCSFIANASYTGVHEHLCKYYPLKCPLGDEHQCSWTGTMGNVQDHLRDSHEDNVYFQQNVFLLCKSFAKAIKKDYTIIFVVHDRLFKFYWSFDKAVSSTVKFGMMSIGNGNPIVIYTYTTTFSKKFPTYRGSREHRAIRSQVKKLSNDGLRINLDPEQTTTKIINHEQGYEFLKTFCNGVDLLYQVQIEVSHLAKCNKDNRFYRFIEIV